MDGLDYRSDAAFSNVGDLPTGFFVYPELRPIYIRPFQIRELNLIHRGRATQTLEHIVRAIDLVTNCDVLKLTDGDFEFIMAWLRVQSFPDVPLLVQWKCTASHLVSKIDKSYYTGPKMSALQTALRGYVSEVCNHNNTEIVHQHQTIITSLEDDFEHKGFETNLEVDFPRVSTLLEYYALIETHPEMRDVAKYARWLKAGTTLKQKIEAFNAMDADDYPELVRVAKKYFHGVKEIVRLRCGMCEHAVEHTSGINHLSFFADNTQTSIMDMQYKLMTAFKSVFPDSTPAKEFLYHYSSLIKDEREEEARRRLNPKR